MLPMITYEGNFDKFHFFNAVEYGERIWIVPTEMGAVFAFDINEKKLCIEKIFDNENFFHENLISGVFRINHKIIFIPGFARYLHVFDERSGWSQYDFRNEKDTHRAFVFAGISGQNAFFISSDGLSMYKFNCENEKIQHISLDRYIRELSGTRIMCCATDELEGDIIVASSGPLGLFRIKNPDEEAKIERMRNETDCLEEYQFVIAYHGKIISIPISGKSIIVDGKIICELELSIERINSWYVIDNELVLAMYNHNEILRFNLQSHEIILNKLDHKVYSGKQLTINLENDFGLFMDEQYNIYYESHNNSFRWKMTIDKNEQGRMFNMINNISNVSEAYGIQFDNWIEGVVSE